MHFKGDILMLFNTPCRRFPIMPLSPKIDQHLVSPYYTGAFLNTKVMRMNKLISEVLTRAGFD